MRVYERVEPPGRCVSPDGHEWQEFSRSADGGIPFRIVCPTCGKPWSVFVFDDEDADRHGA